MFKVCRFQSHVRMYATESTRDAATLAILRDNKISRVALPVIERQAQEYKHVHIDLGTGDGKYPYRTAKKNPSNFYIGVDAQPNLMAETAWRATRKPSRGGINNLCLIWSSVENLPSVPIGDSVSIYFPWSSLLRDLVKPEKSTLDKVAGIAKHRAIFEIVFNYSVFEDLSYLERKEMPSFDLQNIISVYRDCGLLIRDNTFNSCLQPTSWGQHLTKGSSRKTLTLSGIIMKPSEHR